MCDSNTVFVLTMVTAFIIVSAYVTVCHIFNRFK